MVQALPAPEVVRYYFDDAFEPRLPAMCLRWDAASPRAAEHSWKLPEGVRLASPAPRRFGIHVQRLAADAYSVRLLWDRTCLTWRSLTRAQLLTCDLAPLMAAMGTDLWHLLDQPVRPTPREPYRAA
jgi:hypothetical protein